MANKMKSHKGTRKRVKVTASGKVKFKRSFTGHLMSSKTGKRRRQLRTPGFCTPTLAKKVRSLIGE